jgi:hypothetical protein
LHDDTDKAGEEVAADSFEEARRGEALSGFSGGRRVEASGFVRASATRPLSPPPLLCLLLLLLLILIALGRLLPLAVVVVVLPLPLLVSW